MPIKFRCPHCQQFLGISRNKAGNITDCPTCGRTIRIPNLDGSVDALPDPKMNLQDAGLRDALASLASLENESDESDSADPEQKIKSAPFVVSSEAPPRQVVEPAIVQAPAVIEPQLELRPSTPPPEPPVEPSTSDALTELASPASESTPPPPARRHRRKSGGALLIAGVLLSFLAGMGLGYSIGTASHRSSQPSENAADNAPVKPNPVNAAAPPQPMNANNGISIQGTLTYLSANNQPLSDSEARILAFPEQHPGQIKLPIQGFRAGADLADRRVAEAALQALGGEYTTADKGGRYALRLPPGTYHLLFISRYSPRDENAQLIDPVRNLAADYFDRPQLLVGQVNYHYKQLTVGSTSQTIDYQFSDQ